MIYDSIRGCIHYLCVCVCVPASRDVDFGIIFHVTAALLRIVILFMFISTVIDVINCTR